MTRDLHTTKMHAYLNCCMLSNFLKIVGCRELVCIPCMYVCLCVVCVWKQWIERNDRYIRLIVDSNPNHLRFPQSRPDRPMPACHVTPHTRLMPNDRTHIDRAFVLNMRVEIGFSPQFRECRRCRHLLSVICKCPM